VSVIAIKARNVTAKYAIPGEISFARRRERIQQRKKISDAEVSAQIIWSSKLPLRVAPSSCHCQGSEAGRDRQGHSQRCSDKIIISDRCEDRLLAPDRKYFEDSTRNKERKSENE